MVQKWRQKEHLVIRLIEACLAALILVCLVVPSPAEAQRIPARKLYGLSSIRGSFTFAVIGDNRSDGDDYCELLRRVMGWGPKFVANTGDMVDSPSRKNWADFWEKSKPITVPYCLTVGNHDVRDEKSQELYEQQVDLPGNKLYYSFVVGDSLFVFLDSNLPGQERRITGEQYEWLKQVLSTSGYMHKFVFVHHPLYPEKGAGRHYGGSLDKYPEERDRLQALFVKHKVTMVFAGHEHLYLRKTVDGVTHVITGGGGASLYADEAKGGFYHFMLVTVDAGKVEGKVIDINGKVKDTFRY